MNNQKNNKFRPSLSTLILIGLASGVATGLFFGEMVSGLKLVGRAYIGLIQMTILPYMVVSLIGGIGHLSYDSAKRLALTGGAVLLGSWLLAFLIIFVLPLAFPVSEGGTFYSPSLVQAAEVDFIDLYIPSNPFSSLARTVIPAAAVFSVFLGVALIGVKHKTGLLDVFTALSDTFTSVAKIVVKLTPIGVFAISANAAGTMTIDEFGRLQAYIVTFLLATLLLTFWILPALVAVLTPFRYGDVMRSCRDALVTGFVTGNLFIVLPILIDAGKRLFAERTRESADTDRFVEVLIPISFNFPNIGKLLTLLFVLFAGWYTGNNISLGDYPMFSTLGLFALFGGVDMALPFLLDQMRIPSDMYQLYVVTGVINGWFATLIAVMNLYAFTLVATCAAMGTLIINWRRLAHFAVISLLLVMVTIGLARWGLSIMVSKEAVQLTRLTSFELSPQVPSEVHQRIPKHLPLSEPGQSRLKQILERGTLRVGYHEDALPFAFFDAEGTLVGLDIQLYHMLAMELNVTLEFIAWEYDTLYRQLDEGQFDLVAGGLIVNTERLAKMSFSDPYMDVTIGLLVHDYQRNELKTWEEIDELPGFRIGVPSKELVSHAQKFLPETEIVELDSYEQFFTGNTENITTIAISAEAGSAWTILYPHYAVAIPEPHITRPVAIAMAQGDQQFLDFINAWLGLKKTEGTLDQLYDKWILGKVGKQKEPRWSVIRNLLHWVD
ncbi:MAG: cation:dicarboxylase symporter family transporter [Pseudomonadota bacterium]|nr:cation:dicarboxylase symporter family transporter [Pseudomonadota bacterium]